MITAAGSQFYAGLWGRQAGRFSDRYFVDEIVHILEGEVHTRAAAWRKTTLRAGDEAHFAKATVSHRHVLQHVKKLAFSRDARDPLHARAISTAKRMLVAVLSARRAVAATRETP